MLSHPLPDTRSSLDSDGRGTRNSSLAGFAQRASLTGAQRSSLAGVQEQQEAAPVHSGQNHHVMGPEDVTKAREELAKQLPPEVAAIVDDVMIQRFYRATGGKFAMTVKRLVFTAKWRHSKQPQRTVCAACCRNKHAHFMHPVGFDRLGRAVLFTSFIMVQEAAPAGSIEHMIAEFERAVRLMDSWGQGAEAWVWIMDFRGFGRRLQDLNPSLPKNFLDISANHYPERLGALWILDAPSILTPMWNMLRPLMDPVTHAKFKFLPYDVPPDMDIPQLWALEHGPQSGHTTADAVDAAHAAGAATATQADVPAQSAEAATPANASDAAAAAATAQVAAGLAHASSQQSVAAAAAGAHGAASHGAGEHQGSKHHPHKPSKLVHELQQLADDELAQWIIRELRVLRAWDAQQHHKQGKKQPAAALLERPCWDGELLHKAVSTGQLGLLPVDASAGHCHYGTASFLQHLTTCPDVLLPDKST